MDQKKKELMEKVANSMAEGAKKVDGLVDKRSTLGNLSAPLVLGVALVLVVALISNPGYLYILALGAALGMAPMLLKQILEAKNKIMAAKKAKTDAPAAPAVSPDEKK